MLKISNRSVLLRISKVTKASAATIKQHMAAIRMLFSWLTEKGVLAMNPAREVKTERFSRTEGKTPAFSLTSSPLFYFFLVFGSFRSRFVASNI
jgi:site-specific recombinase XerC